MKPLRSDDDSQPAYIPTVFFSETVIALIITSYKWAATSEFVSSSIPSWQISTAHAQPFRGATDLAFCLKVPLDSLLVWASSGGSGETARMRRLAWTFAARIGDKYQIRLARPKYGTIPKQLSLANSCLCFKKGDRSLACTCNYRSVSVTCLPC